MIENLVIVESPAKAKTIEKFLGKDFRVVSSYGHIRDLSKKNLGIDIEGGFIPEYEIPADKQKVVKELKKIAGESKNIWLASDEDREGEAIAWHLMTVLGLKQENTRRIVFHEITKNAISEAVLSPRLVDMNLVNSQQARRILDRIVGFEVSPVLWKKVQPSLSAGRVQSVAVRLLVEREREIIGFKTESAFKIHGLFTPAGDNEAGVIKAEASVKPAQKEGASGFLEKCRMAKFTVSDVTVKPGKRSPSPPFTTSTLQQEAYRKLGFSVSQTMSVAQKLYEAGRITYMRTDSVNLSKQALAASKEVIVGTFGEEYSKTRQFRTSTKGAQEAHEAIRPTYPAEREISGNQNEKRLYDLIWKRTIASQMSEAEVERTTVKIAMSESDVLFTATGEVIKFEGFIRLYTESSDNDNTDDDKDIIPPVSKGMKLDYKEITATERYTTPPPRYTEASLVKKLEELGIGRPSTYAPTISTIQNRGYVTREDRPGEKRRIMVLTLVNDHITQQQKTEVTGKEKSKLFPQSIGMIVTDFLLDNFKVIMDYHFTAGVEEKFDLIAEGKVKWNEMLREFYKPFHEHVEASLAIRERVSGTRSLGNHPETGEPVIVKVGRYGPVVQIGETGDDRKPRFASLLKDQLVETITIEEALKLFDLPRTIGSHNGEEMVAGIGRFGPYVKYMGKFYSLKKGVDDPNTITPERALEIINEKLEAEKNKVISDFGDIKVLNGRYGPYISSDGKNFRIPKKTNPAALTKEDCLAIINSSANTRKK